MEVETALPAELNYTFKASGFTETVTGSLVLAAGVATLESTFTETNTMLLEVSWWEDDERQFVGGGAVAAPAQIQPASAPSDDFDSFWAAKIAELATVPANPRVQSIEVEAQDVDYWQVTMDNIRGTEIRGQLARPKERETFPAVLILQWAGINVPEDGLGDQSGAAGLVGVEHLAP